jgi:hypothetical protein
LKLKVKYRRIDGICIGEREEEGERGMGWKEGVGREAGGLEEGREERMEGGREWRMMKMYFNNLDIMVKLLVCCLILCFTDNHVPLPYFAIV